MFSVIVKNSKGDTLTTVECPVDTCSIGKSRSNLIQLRGWKIAPQHAEIIRTSEGLFVERIGQKAVVEVNGESVTHHGPLHTADKIHIAGYYLQVGEMKKRESDPATVRPGAADDDDEEDDDEDDDEDNNNRNRDRAEGKQDNNESKMDSAELKK